MMNRLIHEKSPYLLQHAHNPVDWHPWGQEAFETARRQDKPVFVSIGYSTCHWCHVMERESFEDEELARLMNDAFISIKVDREERPDIDHIYMTVCQMMTGSGGWPLTIIMTPDKKPFFAGTYFPKTGRFGRMGMVELVPRIMTLWTNHRDKVLQTANQAESALLQMFAGTEGPDMDSETLDRAFKQLRAAFDPINGGFGERPKFPTPHNLSFLLRYWRRTGNEKALEMTQTTLDAMQRGGIYDHIGFGFHRYSTDEKWLLPHFEKMLYDQAMLAMAYIEAWQATGNKRYAATAKEIFTYVLRDMTAPEGAFFSAEDADSEGVEGKFYTWTIKEVREVLDKENAEIAVKIFRLEPGGNYIEEAGGGKTGANVLHLPHNLAETAKALAMTEENLQGRLDTIRRKLFAAREDRIPPTKDDKILVDWNGLMIAALARGATAFGESHLRQAAERAADFILSQMRTQEGRLIHRYRDGQAGIDATLNDYAFFTWGLLDLYEAGFNPRYLQAALELTHIAIRHYWDEEGGGFFQISDDRTGLIVRPKESHDGAAPSGNSVAMYNLLRLARITGDADFENLAADTGRAFSQLVSQSTVSFTQLLCALDFALGPSYEVVIAGDSGAGDTAAMARALGSRFLPNKIVLLNPTEQEAQPIHKIAPFLKGQESLGGKATAYVCINHACRKPTTDVREMLDLLEAAE